MNYLIFFYDSLADEERNSIISQPKSAPIQQNKPSTEHQTSPRVTPQNNIASSSPIPKDNNNINKTEPTAIPPTTPIAQKDPRQSPIFKEEPQKSTDKKDDGKNAQNADYTEESYPQDYYNEQYQYDPNQQYDPSQYGEMYDNQQYDPNQQYMTQEEYDQHYGAYDPNVQYAENQQYDPNQQYSGDAEQYQNQQQYQQEQKVQPVQPPAQQEKANNLMQQKPLAKEQPKQQPNVKE